MIIGGTEKKDTFFFEIVVQLDAQIDKSEGGIGVGFAGCWIPILLGHPVLSFFLEKWSPNNTYNLI